MKSCWFRVFQFQVTQKLKRGTTINYTVISAIIFVYFFRLAFLLIRN